MKSRSVPELATAKFFFMPGLLTCGGESSKVSPCTRFLLLVDTSFPVAAISPVLRPFTRHLALIYIYHHFSDNPASLSTVTFQFMLSNECDDHFSFSFHFPVACDMGYGGLQFGSRLFSVTAFIERCALNRGQNNYIRHLWDITEWPFNTGGL